MEHDPLFHLKQTFFSGSYQACITDSSTVPIDTSSPESLSRTLYIARSYLALTPASPSTALSTLEPFLTLAEPPASARAVAAFAGYLEGGSGKEEKLEELREVLLEYEGEQDEAVREEERVVRVVAGTAFVLEGEVEEAVATLTEGCGKSDLECTALLTQLLLSLDRRDLAQSTYQGAKKWGDDGLLVQVMEAWVGMKTGARPLHQSYYLYEELYQSPSARTPRTLAAHAAAHLLLGHVDEAKADIVEAKGMLNGGEEAAVWALGGTLGVAGSLEQLEKLQPTHPMMVDLKEKSALFDEAAGKFAVGA